jgi:hypothetical protein
VYLARPTHATSDRSRPPGPQHGDGQHCSEPVGQRRIQPATDLLIVDVQPEYHFFCQGMALQLPLLLHGAMRARRRVLAMYVGGVLSRDREPDVRSYWRECGVTERQLARITFLEKDFGFFRGWIDSGVPEDVIVRTARSLRDRSCWSSSDLAPAELLALGADRGIDDDDPLLLPYELEQQAHRFEGSAWTTCGGGIFQCLLETELWLRSREIEFERSSAVY